MRRLSIAVLSAATALVAVPGLVQAQTPPPERTDGPHDRGGDRGRGGGQPAQAPGGQPGGGRDGPHQGGPEGGRPEGGRPDGARPDGGRGGFGGGEDRRGFDGGDRRPDRGGPGDSRGFGGGGDHRGPGDPGGYGGRGFGAGDARPDRRGPGGPGGFAGRNGGYRGQAGAWAPWRGDRRYDWHGWRDQHRDLFRGPRYAPPRGGGWNYRPFAPGMRIAPFFYDRSYWIDDPYAYRLPPAYGPYRWVRYYDDVLLIDLRSGLVVDSVRQFFW